MADETTGTAQDTSAGDGKNTETATGSAIADSQHHHHQQQQQAKSQAQSDDATSSDDSKLFTQADLDRIVRERLAKAKEREDARIAEEKRAAEAQRLKDQGEWKTIAEQNEARLRELEAQIAREKTEALRARVGAKYRLPEHWISRLQGDDEAALEADARTLARDLAAGGGGVTHLGGGTTASAAPGAGGAGGGNVYDRVRKSALAEREAKIAANAAAKPLEDRLGLAPAR